MGIPLPGLWWGGGPEVPQHMRLKRIPRDALISLRDVSWGESLLKQFPYKARCISRNMRIQQHKMSLPPLPTSTLAIIINWVQRTGQILRHGEKVLQIVW